jgi:hypothetical protein
LPTERVWSQTRQPGMPHWLETMPPTQQAAARAWIEKTVYAHGSLWRYVIWDKRAFDELMSLNSAFVCAPQVSIGTMSRLLQLFAWVYSIAARWPRAVQRADFFRYLVVYLWGGFYFDADCMPSRLPLDALLARTAALRADLKILNKAPVAVIFVETVLSRAEQVTNGQIHPIRHGVPEIATRIANYALGADGAGHPFWLAVIIEASMRTSMAINEDYDVLYTSGPEVVSTIWNKCEEKNAATRQKVPGPDTFMFSHTTADLQFVTNLMLEINSEASTWCQTIFSIPHPADQDFFAHMGKGNWRHP